MTQQFYCTAKLSDRMYKTPEGFLVCQDVAITRTGELQYLPSEVPGITKGTSGVIIVERTAEDIFNPETIASFEGKSITIMHPPKFLDSNNYREFEAGHMQNVRKGEGDAQDKLVADFLIKDQAAIKKVESRQLREVSMGYNTEYIEIAPGRARQTDIRGNHGALVPRGRAGPECAIFDSAPKEIEMTAKEKLLAWLGKAVDAMPDDEEEETIDSLKAKLAAFTKKKGDEEADSKTAKDLATAQDALTKATADMAALTAELAELKKPVEPPAKTTYDAATVSAAEILAPGIGTDSATLKADALRTAYGTQDGKAIIDTMTGGKAPVYDQAAVVDVLFNAAAANLAAVRKANLTGAKPAGAAIDAEVKDFATTFAEKAAKVHAIPRF